MARQAKIKDIARMAGVSAGTVDRILHNRGNVSESSRKAVEKVLDEVSYRFNIHTSAVSLRKEYNIIISMPTASLGEYWGSIQEGIEHALHEYSDISIDCRYSFYNQFDVYSCRAAFDSIIGCSPDAVIIGPTFIEETKELCSRLSDKDIPFVFVDSVIEDTPVRGKTTAASDAASYRLGSDVIYLRGDAVAFKRVSHFSQSRICASELMRAAVYQQNFHHYSLL